MLGLSRASSDQLKELAKRYSQMRPLPLGSGSGGKRQLTAVLLAPDGLVPVDAYSEREDKISFDEIEHALITEDVGCRYCVELSLAREGDDLKLYFDSRVVFMMLFSELRAHEVSCRFNFTSARQHGTSKGDPVRVWRWVTALTSSFVALILFFDSSIGRGAFEKAPDCGGLVVILIATAGITLVTCLVLFGVFSKLYDFRSDSRLLPLMVPPKPPEPPIELDEQPVGAAMIASETFAGVVTSKEQPAVSDEAKKISEIERLLD